MRRTRFFVLSDCFTPESFQRLSQADIEEVNKKITQFVEECLTPDGFYQIPYEDDCIAVNPKSIPILASNLTALSYPLP